MPSYIPKPRTIPSTSIRRGPWKLIRFHGDGPRNSDRFELYNLDDDIGETRNQAATHPQRVKQLNAEITQYLRRTTAIVPVPNPSYDPNWQPPKNPPKPAAAPNGKRPKPARLFRRRDKNKDGFLTLAEFIADPKTRNVPALTRQFQRRDANKDSRLTLEEMDRNK